MSWSLIILSLSSICNIEPAKIESVIRVESNYCRQIKNKRSSAMGCMQVLKVNRNVLETAAMRNEYNSMVIGTNYLCKLKASFPRSYMIRYHIGPNGDINSERATLYKNKLNNKYNIYYKGQ
jgi:hypothetical protein